MASILIGNVKGPKGDTGPQGPQGVQGKQGATGPQGAKGATGDRGNVFWIAPKGGTDITTFQPSTTVIGRKPQNGDLYLSGSSYNIYRVTGVNGNTMLYDPTALANIKGAKGDKGDTGAQGPAGTMSASQIFLAAHPVGSIVQTTKGNPGSTYGGTWVERPSIGPRTWERTA